MNCLIERFLVQMMHDCGVKLFATDSQIIKNMRLHQSVCGIHLHFIPRRLNAFLVQMMRDCGVKLFATDSQIIKNIRLHQSVNLWHSFAYLNCVIEIIFRLDDAYLPQIRRL